MNTFLPHPDYRVSAAMLDDARLGKQRLEARQLLDTLRGRSTAWAEHPCTKMWRGHEHQLCRYAVAVCEEWERRGFRDGIGDELRTALLNIPFGPPPTFPDSLYASMRANLVRKMPSWYRDVMGFTEEPSEVYAWPSSSSS